VVNQRVGAKADPAGLDAHDQRSVLDVSGVVRRLRRTSDLSQRDLARLVGIDQSQIARIEASRRGIDVQLFAQILEVGGMRLTIVDAHGVEIAPVGQDVLRDNAGRRMPAHLDVLGPAEVPYFALRGPRYDRAKPRARYHHRRARDRRRTEVGIGPSDDQPTRSDIAAVELAARTTRLVEASRRASALLADDCTCIPSCWEHPGCAPSCECRCGG
jgi:HTH-type transcriptional regulator/antitoxin HipB